MDMERKRLSPEDLNERPHKRIKQQSSDAPSLNRLQELRNYHRRTTNFYLEQARTNKALTSELDRPSARQTEDCSSECKEVSALPNVWDKGKRPLSPDEERCLKKLLKSIPIGPDGKRVPRAFDLLTHSTPEHPLLKGGMMKGPETSRRNDLAGEKFEGPRYGNYCCGKRLGAGGFGEVYIAQHRTSKEIVAIKVLQLEKLRYADEFEYEANVLKSLNHPNIVRFVEYNGNNVPPYLVMEYACHGTLCDAPPKSLKQVAEYVDQIANALDYLHNCPHEIEKGKRKARPLMHLDLKPANILLGEGPGRKILLADLGLAQEVHHSGSQPPYWAGTSGYMAPEVDHYKKPRPESDQYALAIMVYEWLSGDNHPGPNPKPLSGLSDGINKVILKALDNDPRRRFKGVKAFAKAFMDTREVELGIQIDKHYKSGEEHLNDRRYKEAGDDFTRVIALNEKHSAAFAYRGSAYLGLQQYEEALTDYNQALKMNKDNTHALVHRGIILRKKKQYKEALADFNQALALGYSRPWIRKELEELRQLIRGNRR